MNNLINVLIKAKNKGDFQSKISFKLALGEIQLQDKNLEIDWDDSSGEEWARFIHDKYGLVYMINSKIKIIFARKNYIKNIPKEMFIKYEIVIVDNYGQDEWYIDLEQLKTVVPEIVWHTSEDAVNSSKFSLYDLYYATI